MLVGESAPEQEADEVTVEVRLVLEHLHQLQQVELQLPVTAAIKASC